MNNDDKRNNSNEEIKKFEGWSRDDDEEVIGWYTDNDGNSIKDRD